ncbi:MAG: aldehyde dehydrogenase family protein [Verrucomicrobiales bacterium]|nr:aldehyde dehydrogenase family protein [Verrucomicrobiales bacterium]
MNPPCLRTISPVDGEVVVERPLHSTSDIDAVLRRARTAQRHWASQPLEQRQVLLTRLVDVLVGWRAELAREITLQMGRPRSQSPGEIRGLEERARYMIEVAPDALRPHQPAAREGFTRYVQRAPLGIVAVIAPWNYPYLTSINSVAPALLAGNAVVIKHSHQTPLCAERYAQAADEAGLPDGVLQFLHLDHDGVAALLADTRTAHAAFTGSVAGGVSVTRALVGRFVGSTLELGGKDPAYVRADARLDHAVENLVDGAFFNSGQSCCGIERIYVHESICAEFVDRFAALTRQYRLGNPLETATNLGPMVRGRSADLVREQTAEAVQQGARPLIDVSAFREGGPGSPYLAPQVLVDVTHEMRVMREETFGPVVGIMPVADDNAAIRLMNDSDYGLTASIWTRDEAAAVAIGNALETGTVFMNRCDYLDPALAWTGVKDSGRGCSLSALGYESLTRPKSFHLRTTLPA